MVYCSEADKICRPQFKVKTKNYLTSKNEDAQKCCCELDPSPPVNPTPIPVYGPICVLSPYSKTVKRYSMVKGGTDLVCKPGFKLYTENFPVMFKENVTMPYSCCLAEDQNVPPVGPSGKINFYLFTTNLTFENFQFVKKIKKKFLLCHLFKDKANYAGPRCSYKDNKELDIQLMEKCSISMVCRDQERTINKTIKDPVTKLDNLR